jgi:DnaJ-class molecular chaperone
MKDLYKVLGVSEGASDDEIKKAYRKLAKQNHPDATGGDRVKTERFKEINDAYGILGDPEKRKEYERLKRAPVGADGMPIDFDPEAFAQAFGAGGGRGGGFRVGFGGAGQVPGDLGDLFENLFGAGAAAGRTRNPWARTAPRRPRGIDTVGTLELTFEEAALGTRKTLSLGDGRSFTVQVPAGVETGGRLRVPGHGMAGPGGRGDSGDLQLEIVVQPHHHLRRAGHVVELTLPVTLEEAIFGAQIDVPTLEGKARLTVPPGTSSGTRLRLRGKGIKSPDGSRGDQLCRVEIVVPRIAPDDAEARRLVHELAERGQQPGSVRNYS